MLTHPGPFQVLPDGGDGPAIVLDEVAAGGAPRQGLDPDGVIYLGTTSKTLAPGLRIGWIAATSGFVPWALGALVLGMGTAMVYPTLLAAIGDVAHPRWRASAVGVYRLWRDSGFAVGAILAGVIADTFGIATAIWSVAALTALSGLVVAVRMYETHPAEH